MRFLMGFLSGVLITTIVHQTVSQGTCRDYTKKGVVWQGYASTSNNETRCFYRETQYPWRVWQGQAD